jgi:hypothetical protein
MKIYVVGNSEAGGVWLSNKKAYKSFDKAKEKVEQDKKNGIDYTRIFVLEAE